MYGSSLARAIRLALKASRYGIAAFIFREELADIVDDVAKLLRSVKSIKAHDAVIGMIFFYFKKIDYKKEGCCWDCKSRGTNQMHTHLFPFFLFF